MKVLVFAPELCDAQLGCEETCSRTWFKEVDHDKSAIRIITAEGKVSAERHHPGGGGGRGRVGRGLGRRGGTRLLAGGGRQHDENRNPAE